MAVICPTVDAYTEEDYKKQIHKIAHLGHRLQIDLTDGLFTDEATVSPENAWWPAGFKADIHLMYKEPFEAVKVLIKHKPNLIIIHAEADGDFGEVAAFCKGHGVKVGVALLPPTKPESILPSLASIDHVLIFSGNLGYQGGSSADLSLLDKAIELRKVKPAMEIGWDGGVNDQNIAELVHGSVDVINVGSYIQTADDPAKAYETLQRIADETGET